MPAAPVAFKRWGASRPGRSPAFWDPGGASTAGVAIDTLLAASMAALAAAAITRARFARPDASLCANGWVAGLVASSAACASVRPALAMLIGLVAGALVVFSVEWLEFHFTVDDPGGAVSVHALGGIWGVLAAGLFAQFP